MNWKRKWLISLVVTFAMLFSIVGTATATEPIEADVQPTATVATESDTESGTEPQTEEEPEEAAEEGTESETEEEAETEEEMESETKDETEEETEAETEEEAETKEEAEEENEEKDEDEEDDLLEDLNTESSENLENSDSNLSEDLTPDDHEHNWSMEWSYDERYHWHECDDEDCPVTDISEKDGYAEHSLDDDNICTECGYIYPDSQVAGIAETGIPDSYNEVYQTMIALKTQYPEGMTWTNDTPYGASGTLGSSYVWNGGAIYGANSGVGCAAFAFILSDAAFGSSPARATTSFTFEEVKVGDILRINGNSHSVIVLQKTDAGVVIAEANYNKTVHWGRVLTKAEVLAADFIITRYPENYTSSDDANAGGLAGSGTVGSLNWTLTNGGVLTISGSGAIPDYSPSDSLPWGTGYHTIIIAEGVTGIGSYAFYNSPALSIYLPNGLTEIGQHAFYESGLMSVTIPGTVGTIGDSAFRSCANLTSVTVSNGVTTIGENAFRGCTSLTHIDFPASITSLGAGAFMSCSAMTSVRFMPGTEPVTIGDNLFTQCQNLTSVTLPLTANRISAGMFQSCTSLPYLYIPASVTEIVSGASSAGSSSPFASCSHLAVIDFGGSETAWNAMMTPVLSASLESTGTQVHFNVAFVDPFAEDPIDPGNTLPDEDEGGKDSMETDNSGNKTDSNRPANSSSAAGSSGDTNDYYDSVSDYSNSTFSMLGEFSNLEPLDEPVPEDNKAFTFVSRLTSSETATDNEEESADTENLPLQDQDEDKTVLDEVTESEEAAESDEEEIQQTADEEVMAENNSSSDKTGTGIVVTVLSVFAAALAGGFVFIRKKYNLKE